MAVQLGGCRCCCLLLETFGLRYRKKEPKHDVVATSTSCRELPALESHEIELIRAADDCLSEDDVTTSRRRPNDGDQFSINTSCGFYNRRLFILPLLLLSTMYNAVQFCLSIPPHMLAVMRAPIPWCCRAHAFPRTNPTWHTAPHPYQSIPCEPGAAFLPFLFQTPNFHVFQNAITISFCSSLLFRDSNMNSDHKQSNKFLHLGLSF